MIVYFIKVEGRLVGPNVGLLLSTGDQLLAYQCNHNLKHENSI